MRGLWLFNILAVLAIFSPPILLGIAWTRFLKLRPKGEERRWRYVLGAANLIAVSVLLVVCIMKFLGNSCNADAGDWSCVAAWRAFSRSIFRSAPIFLIFTILGARRTRILTFFSVLAIIFDVILVDMMA